MEQYSAGAIILLCYNVTEKNKHRRFLYVALQDKRTAMKKYKEMFTELSITRAKTERELEELRENLRLAHHALQCLHHTSP